MSLGGLIGSVIVGKQSKCSGFHRWFWCSHWLRKWSKHYIDHERVPELGDGIVADFDDFYLGITDGPAHKHAEFLLRQLFGFRQDFAGSDGNEGIVIGWIHVSKCQRLESVWFAEIGGFIVSEEFRDKGSGRQLLKKAEDWTAQNELPKLRVGSKIERVDAKELYSKMGFSISKRQHVFDKLTYYIKA